MKVQVISHRAEVERQKDEAIERAMIQIGLGAQGFASIACPVDTGRLRGSTAFATETTHGNVGSFGGGDSSPHSTPKKGSVAIGTNVEYAPYIEYGARGRKAYHYIRNAMADHLGQWQTIIKNELNSN